MELDVVIDVVCPWCFVGKRQLEKALKERPGVITALRWRPYQLDQTTPPEGVDRKEHYQRKFGDGDHLKVMREKLREVGFSLGINFDFDSQCTIANTLDAHRVIRWALSAGVQNEVVEDIMVAYFEESKFIGDHDLLASIAGKAGMDEALVKELLTSDKDKDLITNEVLQAHQMGIQGVPMYVFNQKTGVSGAQDASVLVQVIDKLQAEAA